MSAPGWAGCLDLFEEHLGRQRSALSEGRASEIHAFRPPEGLGGLPPELRARAEAVAAQAHQLEAAVSAALAGAGRQVQLLSVLSDQDRRRPASYVDHLG